MKKKSKVILFWLIVAVISIIIGTYALRPNIQPETTLESNIQKPAKIEAEEKVVLSESLSSMSIEHNNTEPASPDLNQSPLAAYPGFRHHSRKDDKRFFKEMRLREELIAGCMQRKGFQSTPSDPFLIIEYKDRHRADEIRKSRPPDPDAEYLKQLSPTELDAYNMALYGMVDPNSEDANDHINANPDNCRNEAAKKIPGVYAIASELSEESKELDRTISTDKRIEGAVYEWSRCMEAKGFEYTSPTEIKSAIIQFSRSLDSENPDDVRKKTFETFDATMNAGKACDLEVSLSDITKRVIYEHEQHFVEKHRDLLDKIKIN